MRRRMQSSRARLGKLWRLGSVMLLVGGLGVMCATNCCAESGQAEAAADSIITFTPAQADSLLDLIDDQALQIEELQIQLRGAQAEAAAKCEPSFFYKVWHEPVLWFVLGTYMAVRLTD